VAVQINGGWGNEGAACTITSPATTARLNAETEQSFTVLAMPNPFTTNFVLMPKGGNQSSILVTVYDMLGKQIEQFNVEPTELENRSIGINYSSGIYNVTIAQGDEQRVVRIIKK
jgi:DNA polymerase sigma